MLLEYMTYDPASAVREIRKQEAAKCGAKAGRTSNRRGELICLLLLMYLVVANIGYNLWVEGNKAPIWKLLTANIIYDLWTARKTIPTKKGTVVGILYNREKPCALVNREIVSEGDITNGIKVVRINRHEVEFEKDGRRWTQKVLANPNLTWETSK